MTNPYRAMCAELIDELEAWIGYGEEADCADAHAVIDRARALLAQPVAVSERWPEFSDCDPQERVWVWNPVLDHWKLSRINRSYTHWLPANALPIPEATNE